MQRTFRWADPTDHQALGDVMYDAVRNGRSDYSESQRRAWMPAPRSDEEWSDRLSGQDVLVAESGDSIIGFMSLVAGGYIDFAYLRPEAQQTGLFRGMLDGIEGRARERQFGLLWTHASLMAQPAFTSLGFTIRKREEVAIGAERLDRFEMEKRLSA